MIDAKLPEKLQVRTLFGDPSTSGTRIALLKDLVKHCCRLFGSTL
jgi:hypothetical protein